MTVQELIKELSKYPEDKKVYVHLWGLVNYIGENLNGDLILSHKDTEEEKRKKAEEIEKMNRDWEEETERARREAPRGVW